MVFYKWLQKRKNSDKNFFEFDADIIPETEKVPELVTSAMSEVVKVSDLVPVDTGLGLDPIEGVVTDTVKKVKPWPTFDYIPDVVVQTILQPELFKVEEYMIKTGFTPSSYTICSELANTCADLTYFSKTDTFVLTDKSFCRMMERSEVFVDNVSKNLNIEPVEAMNEITAFFNDKKILIHPTGWEGTFYKVGGYLQAGGPSIMLMRTSAMAKAAGVTGLDIIRAQPFLVVALPTVGALFFHGCGSLAGDTNIVGRTCNTLGNILNLPMAFTESLYNKYFADPIQRVFGFHTLLNYTKQAKRGPGLDSNEALNFLGIGENQKKSILKAAKCFLVEKLGGKCE